MNEYCVSKIKKYYEKFFGEGGSLISWHFISQEKKKKKQKQKHWSKRWNAE